MVSRPAAAEHSRPAGLRSSDLVSNQSCAALGNRHPTNRVQRGELRYTDLPEQGSARVDQLSLGVVSRSRKQHERRLPIHPLHVERIDSDLRERIYLERGYGERFGVPDEQLAPHVAGLLPRQQLIADCDVILLPKPLPEDLAGLRDRQVLWGWPHCVQSEEITQLAIDRHLTLIAFEAMNHWSHDGEFTLHVLHKNNELAGYCSVLHALELVGTTGDYGRRLRAAVIGFGATGRGRVTALNAHGVHDVDVLTHRGVTAVASPIPSTRIVHFEPDADDARRSNGALRSPTMSDMCRSSRFRGGPLSASWTGWTPTGRPPTQKPAEQVIPQRHGRTAP
jgi:hypothetical protein